MTDCTLRNANINDAKFIATMVMMALHYDIENNGKMWRNMHIIAGKDDTLYSWKNSCIAEIGGKPVGLCLAYDGRNYHEMRERTFSLFKNVSYDIMQQKDETGEGEYYIDSFAVCPEYRNAGIGTALLNHAKKIASEMGLIPTLLVNPTNIIAKSLYSKMGFHYQSEIFAFGTNHEKWACSKHSVEFE